MLRQINKKGQTGGLVSTLIWGVVGLVIGVIIAFIIINTLTSSNLLTANSAEDNATDRLVGNFTAGIDNVSGKIPVVFLVAVIVLILGFLAVLVGVWSKMRMGTGGGI